MNQSKTMKLLAVVLLTSQVYQVDALKVHQKDIMSTMLTISSNLGMMAFNKKDQDSNDETSDLQLVQLEKMDEDELTDLMKETFAKPQDKEPSVSEILDKEDKEHDGKAEDNAAVGTDQENMSHMTLQEQMALAKKQAAEVERKAKLAEAEKKKREAAEAKAKKEKALKEEQERIKNEPMRKKQAEEKEMDDFVNSQLEQQRKHTEEYYKELNEDVPNRDPKSVNQVKNADEKVDAELAKVSEQKHTSFANADEALENMGSSLAQHQLEVTMKRTGMDALLAAERKQKSQEEQAAKAAEEEQRKQQEAILAEERAKADAVNERENRLKSKLESLSQYAAPEKTPEKKAAEEEPAPAAPPVESREERLKQKLSNLGGNEEPAAEQAMSTGQDDVNLNNQILNQIQKAEPTPAAPALAQPGKVNMQDLIKKAVAHQKEAQSAPMPAPAPAPKPVPVVPTVEVELPPKEAPVPKVEERHLRPGEKSTSERVEETLQHELLQKGVQAPSDITRALVDSSEGGEPLGHGFFGKYLKKHIDMKKAAEAKVVEEQKAEKERIAEMKRQLSEKIKADPEPQSDPVTGAAPPKKKHKKTLSERAEARLVEDQEKKENEAASKVKEALQTEKLAQAQYLGLDEFVQDDD